MTTSLRLSLGALSREERKRFIDSLSPQQQLAMLYDWELNARPEQIPPADWAVWVIMTGRGWGKTRTGAETVRSLVEQGRSKIIALIAPTAADARDVMLGLNPESSGLLQICPPWNRPVYEPSKRRAVWPNGAVAELYSAEEPDRLRGPQHDLLWGDEPAAWPDGDAVIDNAFLGLRLGESKAIFTTTPRPTPFVRSLIALKGAVVTNGSMQDNPFLSDVARERLIDRYEGTRLGRQELHGEILTDNPDALWTEEMIDADRLTFDEFMALQKSGKIRIKRTVVSIDPAVTSNKNSNETGITVECADTQNPPHGYLLEDLSLSARPEAWAATAVQAYHKYHADRIIGEVNNGGDLIETTIRQIDSSVSYKSVRATRGKLLRAEPVSALYEKHRYHHVGHHRRVESQMVDYDGSQVSPDRLDAHVWAATELLLSGKRRGFASW